MIDWQSMYNASVFLNVGCQGIFIDEKPEHVFMQCAGFKDINEKLIFEGDILRRETFGSPVIGEVVWSDMGFTGLKLKARTETGYSFYSIGRGKYDDDEGNICNDIIIGNIYENPELLNTGA